MNRMIVENLMRNHMKESEAPARNSSSSKEEKIQYATKLIYDARDTGDADIAWELVDFLYDTDLLSEILK